MSLSNCLQDFYSFPSVPVHHPLPAAQNPRYRHPRNKDRLSFIDALFSFVFGDGDPNQGYDDARWAALGLAIQKK
jgi:hypothetical protein